MRSATQTYMAIGAATGAGEVKCAPVPRQIALGFADGLSGWPAAGEDEREVT